MNTHMNTHDRAVLFSSGKDDWQTPPDLYLRLHDEFDFDIDLAADADSALCSLWYGPGSPIGEDALVEPWWPITGWCNPPYTRGAEFVKKAALAAREGATTVLLVPARTDTVWFHGCVWDQELHRPRPGVETRFLKGRLKFVGAKDGAPFPSLIVVFRP